MEMFAVIWPIVGWTFLAMDMSNHHAKLNWDRYRTVGSDFGDLFTVLLCGAILGPIAVIIWAKNSG